MFPQIQFIFRPHPYMFENLINSKVISRKAKDDFIRRFESYPNTIYDEASSDFNLAILDVDALISSGVSAWCQFAATNKPALMLLDSQEDDGLNSYGKNITLGHYRATSDSEIIAFISDVLIEGVDPSRHIRSEIFETFISNRNCTSEPIATYIESLTWEKII
jgi:hypothetical protein